MTYTISKFKVEVLPSKFGGTWNLIKCKFVETGDTVYELNGYGSKFSERVKIGEKIKGYESVKTWNNVETKILNKITAEYVYDLLLKINPDVETLNPDPASHTDQNDGWSGDGVDVPADDTSF